VKIHFCDRPKNVPPEEYHRAIGYMLDYLRSMDGVIAVYQVGGISTPGISDVDLVAVFEDGSRCFANPMRDLPSSWRYLFTHGLYGVLKEHFSGAIHYSFFQGFKHIWGLRLSLEVERLNNDDIRKLKTQIALEYLVRWFISLSVERTYGILRLRGLLLHAKAALFDLEFLNVQQGRLRDMILEFIGLRRSWFENKPRDQRLILLIDQLYEELESFLRRSLSDRLLYLPSKGPVYLSRNITILPAVNFKVEHRGFPLPPHLKKLGRKYFNLQHRFNRFVFFLPFQYKNIPQILEASFQFRRTMAEHNQASLPNFLPLSTSLSWYRSE
jgi:hypothetical protein